MWRELTQRYALRAREFSDAVAQLGKHAEIGPDFVGLMQEIRRRQALCKAAADELDGFIAQADRINTGKTGTRAMV